jgi:hypothetical protein
MCCSVVSAFRVAVNVPGDMVHICSLRVCEAEQPLFAHAGTKRGATRVQLLESASAVRLQGSCGPVLDLSTCPALKRVALEDIPALDVVGLSKECVFHECMPSSDWDADDSD